MKLTRVLGGRGDEAIAEFYEATSAPLVGLLTAMSGNRADAEELAQEAFVRLLGRWDTVSRYDDPEAWLRTVAIRLLISRQRRQTVARLRLPMLAGRTQHADEPSPDGVTVHDALLRLPPDQRAVVLLHHVADLPLEQIARDLELPLGTVKSRLSRGRQALKNLLDVEVPDNV
jgi:RNA polymerase sigma-70 factor (sigma-E family)